MGRVATARRRALIVAGCLISGACAVGGGGSGDASCAAAVMYDGHQELGRGGMTRDPRLTGRRVTATLPGCNDTGGNGQTIKEPDEVVSARELAEVPSSVALEFGGSVYVRQGRQLPPATEAWFAPVRPAVHP